MVRRSVHHGLVLAATALTVLLAGTVLAALTSIAGFAVDAGVAGKLAAEPNATVEVNSDFSAAGMSEGDRAVRSAVARVFGTVPTGSSLSLLAAAPLTVTPGGKTAAGAAVVVHATATQGVAANGRLLSGSWPAGAGDVQDRDFAALPTVAAGSTSGTPLVDAAAPQLLAQKLGLRPGSTLSLTNYVGHQVTVRITGIYQPQAPGSEFWQALSGDPTDPNGLDSGMLVVAPGDLVRTAAFNQQLVCYWDVVPDFTGLDAAQLQQLSLRVSNFVNSSTGLSVFHGRVSPIGAVGVSSELPGDIAALGGPTVVARSALYLPTALLAALALLSLALTARQLAEHRRSELVLQQTRGAGTGRLLGAAAAEWALLVLPMAVLAPFLAGPLLTGLHRVGLVGGELPPGTLGTDAWLAVLVTVLVHGATALTPVVRTVSGRDAVARLRLRSARSAATQRIGADLALLLVAGLGYLQLVHYHSVVVGFDVDPVLVLVPVASTLAAAVLLLRLLPLTSWLLDAFGRGRRGLVLPLAGWQLSRRSARNAGPVVLMCLAVAVGSLATTAVSVLDSLAVDGAQFSVGADVSVLSPANGSEHAPLTLHAVYQALPGVTGATPVTLTPITVDTNTSAEIVGIDTTRVAPGVAAPPLPTLPADLPEKDYQKQLAALDTPTPEYGLPLPAGTDRLSLTETLDSDDPATLPPTLTVTVQDAEGLTQTLSAVLPTADSRPHTLVLPLAATADQLTGPLRITRVSLVPVPPVPFGPPTPTARFTLTIDRLTAGDTAVSTLPAGISWRDRTLGGQLSGDGACRNPNTNGYQGQAGLCSVAGGRSADQPLLRMVIGTGNGGGGASVGGQVDLAPAAVDTVAPVPALADDLFLATGNYHVGSVVAIDLGNGHGLEIRIAGILPAIPGIDLAQGHLLVDQRALAANAAQTGNDLQPAAAWLLSSSNSRATAAALAKDPTFGQVRTAQQALGQLRADPFRSGMRTVLALCRVLAPAFAVIGFTVFAVISTRERRREFALLRAMGTRSRRLATLLWAEQLGVALFAVIPGTLIGIALAVAILPKVVVDDSGGAPFPPLQLDVPWGPVALTALATAGAIWLVVVVLARLLARVDLVRTLRAGEDS